MKYIFNFFYYTYVVVSGPILYIIAITILVFTYPFDKKRALLHKFSGIWGLLYLWISPGWRISYTGKNNVTPKKTYIIVSNHQSMLDIAIIYKLPFVFKWVSKRELLNTPFVGWSLPLHGDILVKRGNASSAKAMVKKCKVWLDRKVSVALFPEGTRSKDGQVHDFKEGAFLLAKMNKVAILPVVVSGTYEATKSRMLPLRQKFSMQVLPEISEEEVASTSIKDMTIRVQNIIAEKHRELAPHLYS